MTDESDNVSDAAARIILLLAEWIERNRCSKSASQKTTDELVRDFGMEIWK